MLAMVRVSEGLIIAHLFLAIWFLVGSGLYPWFRKDSAVSSSAAMMKVVCCCALGISAFGFGILTLAFLGLLRPFSVVALTLFLAFAPSLYWRESPLSVAYWRLRFEAIGSCWNAPLLIIYYVMIVLAFPAVILNFGGSDPVSYHLAYAAEWARSGHLDIDPFLRSPFYASNFVLLFATLMLFHGYVFVNFLTWSMSLLTALAICASARWALEGYVGRLPASLIAICLTLAVFLSPIYLRWNDTAYIDIAIGSFGLFATLSLILGASDRSFEWLIAGAISAGFLIGMKGSFAILGPLFLITVLIAGRYGGSTRKSLLLLAAILVLSSSPWYMRNLILAGDPAPPVFNMALYGQDAFVTKAEWQSYQADLKTSRRPADLLTLPFRAYLHPTARDFREYGDTALMLFLFVPAVAVLLLFAFSTRVDPATCISAVVLSGLVGYWFLTATLLRYSTLFYPLLAVSVAFAAAGFLKNLMGRKMSTWAAYVLAVLAACMLLPTPHEVTKGFYEQDYNAHFRFLAASLTSDDAYLSRFSPDYLEAKTAIATYRRHHMTGRVFVIAPSLNYFFRENDIVSIGDWGGPAGWFRLYRAMDAGRAADFLAVLDAHEIVIDPTQGISGMFEPLRRQLIASGYQQRPVPGTNSLILYRKD